MADYDRRLQRLEELIASADERPFITLEEWQTHTAKLLSSKEMQAYAGREISAEEWAAEWAPIQAAIKAAQGKR